MQVCVPLAPPVHMHGSVAPVVQPSPPRRVSHPESSRTPRPKLIPINFVFMIVDSSGAMYGAPPKSFLLIGSNADETR